MRAIATILVVALGLCGCGRKAEAPAPTPAPAVAASGDFLGSMAAVGTEPFWRVDINPGGRITLTQAGQPEAGLSSAYAAPSAMTGGAAFAAGDLKVRFTAGPCSDGMSDTVYPYAATVTAPGAVALNGCGYAKWSGAVAALAPAIDACMAVSGGRYPVIWAAPTSDGGRVRFDDGEPRECLFSAGKAIFSETNGAPMASERDPLFIRGPADPPAGECGAEGGVEVIDAEGEVIGWLTSDDAC